MERQEVIDKTIKYLKVLPENKIEEALEYIEYLYNKNEDIVLTEGMKRLSAESGSFDFLKDEEDLYTYDDIKEPAE